MTVFWGLLRRAPRRAARDVHPFLYTYTCRMRCEATRFVRRIGAILRRAVADRIWSDRPAGGQGRMDP